MVHSRIMYIRSERLEYGCVPGPGDDRVLIMTIYHSGGLFVVKHYIDGFSSAMGSYLSE